MQNEFEKQVRQKMEELDLVPSLPVWQKIEEQIRQKKDRRRLALWIPLLLVLLAGGSYWIYTAGENKDTRSADHQQENHSIETTRKLTAPTSEDPVSTSPQNSVKEKNSSSSISSTDGSGNTITIKKINQAVKINNPNKENKQAASGSSDGSISYDVFKPEVSRLTTTPEKDQPVKNPVTKSETTKVVVTPDKKEEKAVKEEIKKPEIKKQDSAVVAVQPVVASTKSFGKSRWKFGFTVHGGISGAGERLELISTEKSADLLASPNQVPPPPPLLYSRYDEPSPVKNDLAFSAGFTAKKQLAKKIAFITGLQYEFLSNKTRIGRLVYNTPLTNTSGGYLYSGAPAKTHQNRYHFVSLPVELELQPFNKVPVIVSGGFSVKQLIGTNGVSFNDQSQVYLQSSTAFNTTQLFTGFGIDYSLSLKNMSLAFGPHIQYGLKSLEKNNPEQHLFTAGIRAQVIFQKK